jgi:Transposase DDE domain group 1
VKVSHSATGMRVAFDDPNLVAFAGLELTTSLARTLDLAALIQRHVALAPGAGAANAGQKGMTLVSALLAGAEYIDDVDLLRAGNTAAVVGHHVAAPSTIGTFLRRFAWGNVRQLDAVNGEALKRAWRAGAGPGDAPLTVDIDSTICETYGLQKQGGSRFTDTKVRGYHPLVATASGFGDVLHTRHRGGPAFSGRGAGTFVTETIHRVGAAGATGELTFRADSGFYASAVVSACRKQQARFSITVRSSKGLHQVIGAIGEADWTPIPYWLDGTADVAETVDTPFGKRGPRKEFRLIVRRVMPTPGSQLALKGIGYTYHAVITNREGEMLELEADHRRHAEVESVIRDLKYGVGLNHMPSGKFGANGAWLGFNVLAHNLARWLTRLGGDQPAQPEVVTTKTVRTRYLSLPGRLASSGRRSYLHLPTNWPWAGRFISMLERLAMLDVPALAPM